MWFTIGFIALFGVAVLNGIVLISEFNRLKSKQILGIDEIVLGILIPFPLPEKSCH